MGYNMLHKHGKRKRDFLRHFHFLFYASFLYFGGISNKTIIPLAHADYDMIIVNDARSAELAIYHFISNVHSQNNLLSKQRKRTNNAR